MCSAMAAAARMRPKSIWLSGRNTDPGRAETSWIVDSAPLMLGSPSISSGRCSNLASSRLAMTDVFVDVEVILTRIIPGIVAAHPVEHQVAKVLRILVPKADGPLHCRLDA